MSETVHIDLHSLVTDTEPNPIQVRIYARSANDPIDGPIGECWVDNPDTAHLDVAELLRQLADAFESGSDAMRWTPEPDGVRP